MVAVEEDGLILPVFLCSHKEFEAGGIEAVALAVPQHSRKIAGIISEVMIESSTEHDLLYGPSIADAPKASLKDHTGRGAAGLCEDRPRPNRRKNAANETVRSVWSG